VTSRVIDESPPVFSQLRVLEVGFDSSWEEPIWLFFEGLRSLERCAVTI